MGEWMVWGNGWCGEMDGVGKWIVLGGWCGRMDGVANGWCGEMDGVGKWMVWEMWESTAS